MTAKQLIAKLEKLPPATKVRLPSQSPGEREDDIEFVTLDYDADAVFLQHPTGEPTA